MSHSDFYDVNIYIYIYIYIYIQMYVRISANSICHHVVNPRYLYAVSLSLKECAVPPAPASSSLSVIQLPYICCGPVPGLYVREGHDGVIKWKHFLRYWPFVRGIHRSRWIPHTKASDAELWFFSLICARINDWVNSREAGDLRRHRGHYDVTGLLLNII